MFNLQSKLDQYLKLLLSGKVSKAKIKKDLKEILELNDNSTH